MTDIDKLTEIIRNATDTCGGYCAGLIANHLVVRGVTFRKKWIPVTERLPEEHESIFAKLYGTERWLPGMHKTISNNVLAVIVLEDGRKLVRERHTSDGKWNMSGVFGAKEVTHWMPLPEPPKEK